MFRYLGTVAAMIQVLCPITGYLFDAVERAMEFVTRDE